MPDFNALTLSHEFLTAHVHPGDLCIDATAGRGFDTAFLCGLTGAQGKVLAFDIQQDAIDSTNALLKQKGLDSIGHAILDSHVNMANYTAPESVACITFNFGWLPGGDHTVFTTPQTSIAAIEAGLTLLKPDGVMSLCIYYGRETGFAERDALLAFLPTLDSSKCTVLLHSFCNRPNCPAIPVFILKGI